MPRRSGFLTTCAAIGMFAASPPHVLAEPVLAVSGSEAAQLASLETGDQLVLENYSGTLDFAGQKVDLASFSGILGYATESAYVVTIEGGAAAGELTAARGRMLLIAPFGQGVLSERFDARRLHGAMSNGPDSENFAATLASLDDLARGQSTGVFLGRLGRSNFNVATLGSANDELGRRDRVGGTAIRAARFSAAAPGSSTERAIVERFVAALVGGDAGSAGQFLDPLPYGAAGTADGASTARTAMAGALIRKHDWQRFSDGKAKQTDDLTWVVESGEAQATIVLRRTSEFAFVSSIAVGE